jgi:hypothetical protein
MAVCQGRLAIIELPDKTPIAFVKRPEDKKPILFSAPKACAGKASSPAEPLCAACQERRTKTAAAVAKAGGKYVPNQQTLLHGLFSEALPEWSHMFGSAWFNKTRAEKRLEITAAVAAVLPKTDGADTPIEMPRRSVAVVVEPSAQPSGVAEPTAVPSAAAPKKRATKKVVGTPAAPVVQVATPLEPPKRKFAPKKKAAAAPAQQQEPTLGVIQPQPLEGITVKKISVRKTTIDERTVYLSAEKDKVYDLKFNYIGRYNRRDDRIESKYTDSDKE